MSRSSAGKRRRPTPKQEVATPYGDSAESLEGEIAMVRQALRQLHALAQDQDPQQAVRTLNALCASAARLARLIEAQVHLRGGESPLAAALSEAVQHILQEYDACP